MIANGLVSEKGAFAPEGCLDADICLMELAKRGIEVNRSEETL